MVVKRDDLINLVDNAASNVLEQINDILLQLQEDHVFDADDLATFNANLAAEIASRMLASTAFHSGNTLPHMISEHKKALTVNAAVYLEKIIRSGVQPGEPLSD